MSFATDAKADIAEPVVMMDGEAELLEVLDMVLASDLELAAFLDENYYLFGEVANREELITFLGHVDSVPFPVIPHAELRGINYCPQAWHQSVDIYFAIVTDKDSNENYSEWYSFDFYPDGFSTFNGATAKEAIENETRKKSKSHLPKRPHANILRTSWF